MCIDLNKIILQEEVRLTCQCFGLDPYKSISEGTLLATANQQKAKFIVAALEKAGFRLASLRGYAAVQGMRVLDGNKSYLLKHPKVDPFWGSLKSTLRKDEPSLLRGLVSNIERRAG